MAKGKNSSNKDNDKSLGMLHELLVTQYVKLMEDGCEDPRILKEIRELLKDNDITGDISETLKAITSSSMVEMPDDWDIVNG